MRWTEQPPQLPLQPLDALTGRESALAESVRQAADEPGLHIAVAAIARATALQHLADHREECGGLLLGEVFADGDDPCTQPGGARDAGGRRRGVCEHGDLAADVERRLAARARTARRRSNSSWAGITAIPGSAHSSAPPTGAPSARSFRTRTASAGSWTPRPAIRPGSSAARPRRPVACSTAAAEPESAAAPVRSRGTAVHPRPRRDRRNSRSRRSSSSAGRGAPSNAAAPAGPPPPAAAR